MPAHGALPAVVVAAPAPAFAASTGPGVITVSGFDVFITAQGQIGYRQFSIRYDANGGAASTDISYMITTNPVTFTVLSGRTSLASGQSRSLGPGATAHLQPRTYVLILTVTSPAAPTVTVTSDPITIN